MSFGGSAVVVRQITASFGLVSVFSAGCDSLDRDRGGSPMPLPVERDGLWEMAMQGARFQVCGFLPMSIIRSGGALCTAGVQAPIYIYIYLFLRLHSSPPGSCAICLSQDFYLSILSRNGSRGPGTSSTSHGNLSTQNADRFAHRDTNAATRLYPAVIAALKQ